MHQQLQGLHSTNSQLPAKPHERERDSNSRLFISETYTEVACDCTTSRVFMESLQTLLTSEINHRTQKRSIRYEQSGEGCM